LRQPSPARDEALVSPAGPAIWQPDWGALARHIVERTLRLQPGERVVYLTDPYLYPQLLDALRESVVRAGGVEQATVLAWTPRLAQLRNSVGQHPDRESRLIEDRAQLELFNTADVFIWLPQDAFQKGTYTRGQTESTLARWRGRGLHFHWFPDWPSGPDHPIHTRVHQMYQRAILDLDYEALRARQERLVAAVRGRRLHITTPDGTDLALRLPAEGWYHRNDGDASRAKVLSAVCARDREEELPCGAVRALPLADSAEGVISYRRGQALASGGMDVSRYTRHLDLVFHNGRITEVRGGDDDAGLQTDWKEQTGDKDRLSEIVFGTNPLLQLIDGARVPPYWGFGAGVFRCHVGDIVESGGPFQSSLALELFMTDATVVADDETVIRNGALLVE
jgi:leucyl aminopeptidase (aminopeptidase T)